MRMLILVIVHVAPLTRWFISTRVMFLSTFFPRYRLKGVKDKRNVTRIMYASDYSEREDVNEQKKQHKTNEKLRLWRVI